MPGERAATEDDADGDAEEGRTDDLITRSPLTHRSVTRAATETPSTTPRAAPVPTESRPSTRNCRSICRGDAPMAERMPISSVRSTTDTS